MADAQTIADDILADAQTIADDILKLAKREGLSLTPMQLMKLVYISYGWHLAMTNHRLFSDRIEAWKYGPVIPNLYQLTKHFGGSQIPLEFVSDAPLTHPDLERFLAGVVSKYGGFSGIALSNLTHRKGTPWQRVYREGQFNLQIPDSIIREHYGKALNARRTASAPV